MGRGAQQHAAAQQPRPWPRQTRAEVEIARRVALWPGIVVSGSGELTQQEAGYVPGTSYVDIQAKTLMDCERAADLLFDVAGLPDLAWEHGWTDATSGAWPFEVRIFPTFVPAHR